MNIVLYLSRVILKVFEFWFFLLNLIYKVAQFTNLPFFLTEIPEVYMPQAALESALAIFLVLAKVQKLKIGTDVIDLKLQIIIIL